MAYSNTTRHRPGRTLSVAELTQELTNLKHLAGQEAGQTALRLEAPLSTSIFESKHASRFELVKEFDAIAGTVAEHELISENIDEPSSIEDGYDLTLRASIVQIGGSEQDLGEAVFTRLSDAEAILDFFSLLSGNPGGGLTVGPDGSVGIMFTPDYTLDVGAGTINVSGGYYINGVQQVDWTEVAGPKLQWTNSGGTGHATVSGAWKSTVGTGTEPIVVTSTTEATNLDADTFDDHGWAVHTKKAGNATYTSSDTTIVTSDALGKTGVWDVSGNVSVWCAVADDGKTIEAKLKNQAGTQFGATADQTAKKVSVGGFDDATIICLKLFGFYTAAATSDTVKITVAVPTGTGSLADGWITARWVKP